MPQTLDDILLSEGVVDRARLDRARAEARRRNTLLVPTLIDLGFVGERSIAEVLSRARGVPLIDPVPPADVAIVCDWLPAGLARALLAVPLDVDTDGMTVAIVDPTNEIGIATLRELLRLEIICMVGIRSDLERLVDRFYPVIDDQEDLSLFNPRALTLESGGRKGDDALQHLAQVGTEVSARHYAEKDAPSDAFGPLTVIAIDATPGTDTQPSTARSQEKSASALSSAQRIESLESRVMQLFRIVASLQTRFDAIEARLSKLSKP